MKSFEFGALLVVLPLAAVLAACSTTKPTTSEQAAATTQAYRVGPSDQLTIRVLPEPAIELTELKVRPDGRISVELIGDVDAAGRTTDEIAADIQQRMEQYRQSPSVSVSVVTPSSTTVSVMGEVKNPGSFALEREIRVAEIVAMAGGQTELAATKRVRVVRRQGAGTVLLISDLDAVRGGDGSSDILLQKGDLVVVPAATPVVAGYKLRRALYPIEAIFRIIGSGLFLLRF